MSCTFFESSNVCLPPIADIWCRAQNVFMADEDETCWEERLKRAAKHKEAPNSPEHKKVGDETLNPAPDHPNEGDSKGGGDPGRV